jgi:CDP-diacylglycerol--serine O-phosphatidyltransferase
VFIAALMISAIPTYSWASLRIRRDWRLFALAGIALLGAALIVATWTTLLLMAALYLLMIPFSLASYARLKRRRARADRRA